MYVSFQSLLSVSVGILKNIPLMAEKKEKTLLVSYKLSNGYKIV